MKITTFFAFGLCCYLRQIELSLDRSFNEQEQLKLYARSKLTKTSEIIAFLTKITPIDNPSRPCHLLRKIIFNNFFSRLFFKIIFIEKKDTLMIIELLNKFSEVLKLEESKSCNFKKGYLREEISNELAYLRKKLPLRMRCKIDLIEHLNQNEIHKHQSMQELIGSKWP